MARIFDKVLADPRVRFFGNVTYGIDLRRQELKRLYHQIVYAVGAQADRRMSIPGEDLPNSFPASSFVGWYNGHPDYRDLPADLSCERAVVIGNGNVAMDVTRILVTSPDALAGTDIADHALEKLRHSKIREVVVLGRRGPVQASFTTPEIRELGKLDGMDVIVDPRNLRLEAASKSELDEDPHRQGESENSGRLCCPRRPFRPSPHHPALSRLAGRDHRRIWSDHGPENRAERTGHGSQWGAAVTRTRPVRGHPDRSGAALDRLSHRADRRRAFDPATSTINNIAGQVVHPNTGEVLHGEYVVGWAKRGPTGLIGNNKADAAATVNAMVADLPALPRLRDNRRDPSQIEELLRERGIDYVTYADWQILDRYEVAAGRAQGRPRVKVTTVPEMMTVIREGR